MADERTLFRRGIVSDVDEVKKKVRVYFPDLSNMVSDWLFVPQRPFEGVAKFAPFHVDAETGSADGHTHPVYISYSDSTWLPKKGVQVLVVYEYGFNSAGYVLGVIG